MNIYSRTLMKLMLLLAGLLCLNCVRIPKIQERQEQIEPIYGIRNGEYVKPGEVPYQVFVMRNGKRRTICGGVLFLSNKVLTAAHCVDTESKISIRYGTEDVSRAQRPDIAVKHVRIHHNYKPYNNDLAVLTIDSPIPESVIRYATLERNELPLGTSVMVYGWGIEKHKDKDNSDQLKKLMLKITKIEKGKIIAKTPQGSICSGDSGGIMVGPNGNVVGIASTTTKGCPYGSTNKYIKVSAYIEWIYAFDEPLVPS